VLGPELIPVIEDPVHASKLPELAVLSAMSHGSGEPEQAARIGLAALSACIGLEGDQSLLYSDLIRISLGEAAKAALEELMANHGYEFQSEFARRHEAIGRAEGEAIGRAEGEAAGMAKGEAQALLAVLRSRGLGISQERREQILACTDPDQLEHWIERAATASTVDEIFG
jgi:predicted transposase YdaD